METVTVNDAIQVATRAMGKPWSDGLSVKAVVPYYSTKPQGPSTEISRSSWHSMREALAEHKVESAVAYYCEHNDLAYNPYEFMDLYYFNPIEGDWRKMARKIIRDIKTAQSGE